MAAWQKVGGTAGDSLAPWQRLVQRDTEERELAQEAAPICGESLRAGEPREAS